MNIKDNSLIKPDVIGNVLHINVCNMDEFEKRMQKVNCLAQQLNEAITELNNFNLKIQFSDNANS